MNLRKNGNFRVMVCAAIAALLTACGGSDDPNSLQKYYKQTVTWNACDPTILGVTNEETTLAWSEVKDAVRCAFIKAPMDWFNPDRGDVVLSMMRMAATTPAHRKGAYLLNPGGPGSDGLKLAFRFFMAFKDSNPDNPQGAKQLQLLDEYDMIGFSPRGVGASTRLECGSNELTKKTNSDPATWDTAENISNVVYNNQKKAEACLKNPLTPYINSEATARDMELMRSLLGDEKLNYIGYSYGTWLGSWYANLFPDRVGKMLLDSSVDFTTTFEQAVNYSQPAARQELFDEFMAPYAVKYDSLFGLGQTVAEVQAIPPSLDPVLHRLLGAQLSSFGYKRVDFGNYIAALAVIKGLDVILKSVPDTSNELLVNKLIAGYVFVDTEEEFNQRLQDSASDIYDSYLGIKYGSLGYGESISLEPSDATYTAISCNDATAVTDSSTWLNAVRQQAQTYPLFFSNTLEIHTCAYWGGPRVKQPDIAPMKPLNLLFVQSQYDGATYTKGASKFFAQLPNARRVYVANEFAHGVYPYGDNCVDPNVTAYLLGETLAVRELVCQGKPQNLDDDEEEVSNQKFRSNRKLGGNESQVYRNPASTRRLLDEFRRGIAPAKPL